LSDKNGTCLACESGALRHVRPYRTDSRHGREILGACPLHECAECGLVQISPVPSPEALAEYYAIDYRMGGRYGSDVADTAAFPYDNLFYLNRGESIAELLSEHIDRLIPDGRPRVLDIGAGFGHILHAVGRRYPDSKRFANEISEVCVQHLRSLGVEVFTTPTDELLPRLERQFHVVILSHVLEHLPNPVDTLRQLRKIVVPGGLLYIEVPNIPADSVTRYPDSKWAPRVDEPHITFFSLDVLRSTLERAGWSVRFCDTAGTEYRYISKMHFALPRLQPFILSHIPRGLMFFLRRQRFTNPLRVQQREETFYEYGGPLRIWLRSVSTAAD